MKNLLTTVLVASSLTISSGAIAAGGHHKNASHQNHDRTNWAKVVDVRPITRTVERRNPYEQCWLEEVRYNDRSSGDSYDSPTGTIIGGIIGGALGNAVGHKKKNKQIGTAVGAILGATIGHDITRERSHRPSSPRYRQEERCETHYDIIRSEETIGYDVWYRYNGERFHTRMDEDPGKKIRVRVSVTPF